MKELQKIQEKLNAPKNLENEFGGYRYRSAEGILEALKPLLAENGCTLVISDDIVETAGRVYVKASATIKNEKGETETATAFAREAEAKKGMDVAQITGATSSYARKYALNGLFAIDDTKDPDATNDHGKNDSVPKKEAGKLISAAFADIAAAKTKEELAAIWNKYTAQDRSFAVEGSEFYNYWVTARKKIK